MALFKNLYLDLSYLNPFKKRQSSNKNKNSQEKFLVPPQDMPSNYQNNSYQNNTNAEIPTNLELPSISKRLLTQKENEKVLPKIEKIDLNETNKLEKKYENKANLTNINEKSKNENIVMPPPMMNDLKKELKNDSDLNLNQMNQNQINTNQMNLSYQNLSIQDSFFSDIYSHLSSDEKIISKNISNKVYNPKLLEEMQNFWNLKKEELSQLQLNSTLKNELLKKLTDLQKHEIEWQKLQLEKERLNDVLFSKEIIIENQIKHIKKLFKKLHLSSNVPLNQEFILPNGTKLNNLNELINALKTMQDEFFYFHVNEHKNDFYNWIKDVFCFNDLAEQIKNIKNKEQMAEIIEKWANSV